MTWIRSCKDVTKLLSLAQERPLTLRERFDLHVHLPLCEGCRNFKQQLAFMREALRRFRDGPPR